MSNLASQFQKDVSEKVFDEKHRKTIRFNMGRYDAAVERGLSKLVNLEENKQKAHLIKWQAIEHLDRYLIEFESNFTKRGGKVIWASTVKEAQQAILDIAQKHQARSVIKSKSMATEEIELNHCLENKGIKVWESDLGEFIVQLLGQKPYHIVTPAMHLSKQEIATLFNKEFGTALDASPEALTQKAREVLRQEFVNADIGITGANFIVADTGSISITENEGNARLTTTFPRVHIAIVGIEKIIPSINDLATLLPLLATHGTGQNLTVYNTLFSGPRQDKESDGPMEMYVVLLDNGRSHLLAQKQQRQALYCIRCGACLNACPVYRNIGGHAYNTTYSGPIGSVITPHLQGMKAFKHLSYASTLCGKCAEVCPVKINIPRLLLLNRREAVVKSANSFIERCAWWFWKRIMLRRERMDNMKGKAKNRWINRLFGKLFGSKRLPYQVAEASYAQSQGRES